MLNWRPFDIYVHFINGLVGNDEVMMKTTERCVTLSFFL